MTCIYYKKCVKMITKSMISSKYELFECRLSQVLDKYSYVTTFKRASSQEIVRKGIALKDRECLNMVVKSFLKVSWSQGFKPYIQ